MASIATLSSGPPTGTGGTDRHLSTLVRLLRQDGHEVDCYHFEQLNPPRPWSLWDRFGFRAPAHGMLLSRRVLAHEPQYAAVFANSFLGAFLPADGRVVNVFHSCDAAFATLGRAGLGLREYLQQRYVWGSFEARSARRHFVVAISPSVEREMRHYYGVQADAVIPYGIDTAQFSPGDPREARVRLGLPPDERLLLFCGTWCYRKGADLINALIPDLPAGCRVVAASPHAEPGLPVDPRMTMLAGLSAEDVVWAYRAADMLLFPTRAESFGFVTAEAMACGLPVVTTTAGLGEDLQRDARLGRWVVDCPPAREPLRERVTALLDDPDLRRTAGAACREYVLDRFSLQQFDTSYRKLLDRFLVPARA